MAQSAKWDKLKKSNLKINNTQYVTYSGHIEVLENRSSSSSRKLRLPVLIIKSSSPNPKEPVFWLDGGPGQSNMATTKNEDLLKQHDFVCVGYRGADGSIILKSRKLNKAMKGRNHNLLSNESLDNLKIQTEKFLQKLNAQGTDVTLYNIMEVIEDIEIARKELGYEKINLLSISYGTRVALLYSYKYPQVVHRIVMVGANPPGHFIWHAKKTDEIISMYDSLYKQQDKLHYRGSIRVAMQTAFAKMPKRWSLYRLDPDKIKVITFIALYQKDLSVMAFHAYFDAAQKGDYSGLYFMQLLFDYLASSSVWGEMFAKGYSADFMDNVNYRAELRADSTTLLGANYSLLLWGGPAGAWPKQTIPEEFRKMRISDHQVLIISGDLDVSTPADYAKNEILPFLKNGRQVVLKHMSHADLVSAQRENYRKFVAGFFSNGIIDEPLFHHDPVSFTPKRRFSRLAKTLYPLVMVISLVK